MSDVLIVQDPFFARKIKKLHAAQREELYTAIRTIADNPEIGEFKKGDLQGFLVFKFRINKQVTLLAYLYAESSNTITLLAFGSHENFYRDLKR